MDPNRVGFVDIRVRNQRHGRHPTARGYRTVPDNGRRRNALNVEIDTGPLLAGADGHRRSPATAPPCPGRTRSEPDAEARLRYLASVRRRLGIPGCSLGTCLLKVTPVPAELPARREPATRHRGRAWKHMGREVVASPADRKPGETPRSSVTGRRPAAIRRRSPADWHDSVRQHVDPKRQATG